MKILIIAIVGLLLFTMYVCCKVASNEERNEERNGGVNYEQTRSN